MSPPSARRVDRLIGFDANQRFESLYQRRPAPRARPRKHSCASPPHLPVALDARQQLRRFLLQERAPVLVFGRCARAAVGTDHPDVVDDLALLALA